MTNVFRPSEKMTCELFMVSRFTMIGLLCSFIHIGTAILFKEIFGFGSIISSNIGFMFSFLFSFFGHYKYSFSAEGSYRIYFFKFCIMSIISFCVSAFVVWAGTDCFSLNAVAVFMSLAIIVPAFNFIVSRFWVFKPDRTTEL